MDRSSPDDRPVVSASRSSHSFYGFGACGARTESAGLVESPHGALPASLTSDACGLRVGALGKKNVRRSISRVLSFTLQQTDDHSSRAFVTERLMQPTRATRGESAAYLWTGAQIYAVRLLFGFASGGVFHAIPVTRNAVRSYRTFSPFPAPKGR